MRNWIQRSTPMAIVACLLWSTAFAGIKTGMQYTTPFQFAGIRFYLAGVLIIPLTGSIVKYIKAIVEYPLQILIISLTQTFILYALFYKGISLLPGSITAITVGAQPLFIAVISHFAVQHDKLTFGKTMCIVAGISGVLLIAIKQGITGPTGGRSLLGISLLILSNISSGIGNIYVHNQKSKMISPVILSSWQLVIGGIGLFILSLFTEPFHGFTFPLPYYLSLGWLSFISAAAFTLWFILLQRPDTKVSSLNIWKFIIPVFGAILSWIILPGESPDLYSIAGMIIIGLSLIWYNLTDSKKIQNR